MGDTPSDDERRRSEDLSKLELPSLRLPGFGRRKNRAPEPPDPGEPADEPPAAAAEPDVMPEPELVHEPAPAREPVPAAAAKPEPVPEPVPARVEDTAVLTPDDTPAAETPAEPRRRAVRRPRVTVPTPAAWVAALLTGLVVGVVGAALTSLTLRGCDAVRGTESCGAPGLFLQLVVVVVMVLLGAVVLALLHVPEPRATSVLGVGVLCVVALLVLFDALTSPWMFLVVPLVCGAGFVLAHRVTTAFVEPRPERGPEHDVR